MAHSYIRQIPQQLCDTYQAHIAYRNSLLVYQYAHAFHRIFCNKVHHLKQQNASKGPRKCINF